ncbi:PD-(D/E)XK nuclease family protein [Natrinema salsiterrestre]|uniref:PD-(D/E)XK nuclease family protein n=1 Tax=Natrinema salsiterrestre TaxID=2950540 RepID=A0A9Q4Q444_9EURY|nr:PD-(D/E)XK nuclease family protein [Natrinema salsiterrestre]MDF9748216.1 PD-(D/E)XK nuclease family protein [Natrinema salsiterrestre]
MSITRATPLDTLYEQISDYDLVLVPDAPLASALNRRLDRPHFGPFAVPPRRLAAGRRETAEDRTAFLELVEHSDLDWKRSAYAIGNILQCWEHQGRLDSILEYNGYADAVTEEAVAYIDDLETTSGRLTEYRIDADTDVAVVGEDQLTALERSILPAEYDTYSPFSDQAFERPPFRIFESTSAIVDTVVDSIAGNDSENVAVVLDQASPYSTLVESAFESAEIPFYGGPGFIDDSDHRAFCQLLRVAHRGTDTEVRDVKPVLRTLGVDLALEHDEKRLSDLDIAEIEWVRDFCDTIENRTVDESITAFEQRTGCSMDAFRDEVAALCLDDEFVTEETVDRLEFYLQTYEVPVDRENEGVLLADAKSAAYVDRPVVFFLGLDENWTHSAPRRPWVDRDAQYTRNIQQFQLLLQSGVEQYYLVQDTSGGSPVTPCLYFEELLEEEFDRFSDLESIQHAKAPRERGTGFEKEPVDATATEVETISQSSLSTYVNCPRDYFFSRLVDGPDKDYFEEGNLFHDFAEFYVEHRDAVDDALLDETVEVMLEETRPFVRRVDRKTRRTKYRVGLETIRDFLDENVPTDGTFLTAESGWGSNFFAERYDRPIETPITERWFENDDLGLKGKIDLIHGPTRLVDHKSGSRKRASQVVTNSAIDPPAESPNFQALLYLTHWRTERPEDELEFTFFHFLETLDDVVAGDADLEDTLTTVTYHPTSFEGHAESRAVFEDLREDGAGNCRKTLEKVTYDDYRAVFEVTPMPDTRDSDELIESEFGQVLIERMKECVGDYKYVSSGCKQLMRELMRVRSRNYFREDLDAFEEFVDDRIAELNRRRRGEERFPVEGLAGEPNYRYVDNRDLLLNTDD